ncbi:helix-turn-helix domain-containing protein [Streptomyces sp. NPDC096033]|uniref:helix-turn-helix domain-containing protein n=1 Tax=Streptomyces sp. NPDC096033 TaxID=3366071 RepID=UPI0038140B51
MSKEAMDWALEFAPPMPSQLIATLSGLARHADKAGRGTYPSVARLAAYACKSERSVQRDLLELKKLGLIRLGDQQKAAHLPEGKRPEVYDLAVEMVVPGGRAGRDEVTLTSRVTLASSRRRGGRKKSSSDALLDQETGDVDVRGDVDVTGDVDVADGVTSTSREGRRPRHPNQKKNLSTEGGNAGARPIAASAADDDRALAPIDEFGFKISDEMRRWAKRDGFTELIDIDYSTAQFLDHYRSTGAHRHSWPAAWQKWIREDANREAKRRQRPHLRAVAGLSPEERGIF